MSLDKTNQTPAYLCGRLFAVLEKLQQDASNNSLNRTIKDAYFASASAKPALVFPKLIRLAQNHLSKGQLWHIGVLQQIDGGDYGWTKWSISRNAASGGSGKI